jgi:nitrous oxidase accessory protein NosD
LYVIVTRVVVPVLVIEGETVTDAGDEDTEMDTGVKDTDTGDDVTEKDTGVKDTDTGDGVTE